MTVIEKEIKTQQNINDVQKIVKTSFLYDVELDEVIVEPKKSIEVNVSYTTSDYYDLLKEYGEVESDSYDYARHYKALTKKELMLLIDKILTAYPYIFSLENRIARIKDIAYQDHNVFIGEETKEISDMIDIINCKNEEIDER